MKAVLFDLDNTLIDFMHVKRFSVNAALDGMLAAGLAMNKKTAEKTLNLPAYLITGHHPEKVAYHFRKKSSEGVRAFFLYSFLQPENRRPLLFYDDKKNKMTKQQ